MEMPKGFLGTEADFLMDALVSAVPIVFVVMTFAWVKARRGEWTQHRNTQIILSIILGVAVGALEFHVATSDGLDPIIGSIKSRPSLGVALRVHLFFAITTSVVWVGLILSSLIKFPSPPEPNNFSRYHRFFGRLGMLTMIGTGLTAVALYLTAFVL
jgi:putative membrane protein